MIFQFQQIRKSTEVLRDLVKINNDRIAGYQSTLNYPGNLSSTVKETFNHIIFDGIGYNHQLIKQIREIDGDTKNNGVIPGKIYRAWRDLMVNSNSNSKNAIISLCMFNEEIALHSYRAAISKESGLTDKTYMLLNEQKECLKMNYDLLKSYKERKYTLDASLMYMV